MNKWLSIRNWLFPFVLVFTLSISSSINAQKGPPKPPGRPGGPPGNGNGGGPPCWPKPCDPMNVPIDGGIEYLVIAAVLYGARKSYLIHKGKMTG